MTKYIASIILCISLVAGLYIFHNFAKKYIAKSLDLYNAFQPSLSPHPIHKNNK